MEFLGDTAAALGEPGIADFLAIHQNLSLGLADSFCHMRRSLLGDALVALAVVVGADIKDGVVFAVVPADEHVVFLDKREKIVAALSHVSALLHLCQEP